jgi:hypothetical protein
MLLLCTQTTLRNIVPFLVQIAGWLGCHLARFALVVEDKLFHL